MKLMNTLLPLAVVSSALIIPDGELTDQIILQSQKDFKGLLDRVQGNVEDIWSGVEESFKDVAFSQNALDRALNAADDADVKDKNSFECYTSMAKFEIQEWLDSGSAIEDVDLVEELKDWKPHLPKRIHRPPCKLTTKLAKLINEYPDLVKILNGTTANYTVFAPTDKAFEKLPKGQKKPSKELIEKVLSYHISPDFYPAARILGSQTIPTALGEDSLGREPQRLRVTVNTVSHSKGLNLNFYSRVVAVNIFGTNGVIHGVDTLILPPPPAYKIIEHLPTEFSTLQRSLQRINLFNILAHTLHSGGTLFAPSNEAFLKLGSKVNSFLFSKHGEKFLAALLKYHIVPNHTLYTDALYQAKDAETEVEGEIDTTVFPNGYFHVDLPTLLEDKGLSIDIARLGGLISIKINGFNTIAVSDGIAKDGVIHVVSSVLVPPKNIGYEQYRDEEMDLDEFKERVLPFVEEL